METRKSNRKTKKLMTNEDILMTDGNRRLAISYVIPEVKWGINGKWSKNQSHRYMSYGRADRAPATRAR